MPTFSDVVNNLMLSGLPLDDAIAVADNIYTPLAKEINEIRAEIKNIKISCEDDD